jgi:hypothetical protein
MGLVVGGLVAIGLAMIPMAVGASTPPRYQVSASTSRPQVNCASADQFFNIPVSFTVNYRGKGRPTQVVAKYIGGSDVTLTLKSAVNDVATYTGTIRVPRNILCEDAPDSIRFRALATRGSTRGEGVFYVNSVGNPSENGHESTETTTGDSPLVKTPEKPRK